MKFLRQAIPLPDSKSIVKETIFLSGFCFLFLIIFQPFGTHSYSHPYKVLQLAGYGLIVLTLYPVLRILLLHNLNKQTDYTLATECVVFAATLFVLTFAAFIYHGIVISDFVNLRHLPVFMLYGAALGSLPFGLMLYGTWLKNKNLIDEEIITPGLPDDLITIKGLNKSETLVLKLSDLLYLKSGGNYVEVIFLKEGTVKSELIRNTLSNVGNQLPPDIFINAHRSYLVNLLLFHQLIREEGSYKLLCTKFNIKIPVSRNLLPIIETRLNQQPLSV